jgi:hypothetical protein
MHSCRIFYTYLGCTYCTFVKQKENIRRPKSRSLHRKWKICQYVEQTYGNFLFIYMELYVYKLIRPNCYIFLSLVVFREPEVLLFIYSSAAPQRTAYSEVTIPEGNPSKDWQSNVGCGYCQIRTRNCRFTIWCRYQWATTIPNNEPSLYPTILIFTVYLDLKTIILIYSVRTILAAHWTNIIQLLFILNQFQIKLIHTRFSNVPKSVFFAPVLWNQVIKAQAMIVRMWFIFNPI